MNAMANSCLLARNFSRQVERWRQKRGMTKMDLAAEAGISRVHLDRILKNLNEPTIGVIDRISKALRVPVQDLLEINFREPAESA